MNRARASLLLHHVRDRALPLATGAMSTRIEQPVDAILILQPDHLGDVLLSQPAVAALRAAFPNDRLVAVVGPWSREIAEIAWPVDEVMIVQFPGFDRTTRGNAVEPYRLLADIAPALRAIRARMAVVLRPDAWWAAALAAAAGIPTIVTSDDERCSRYATHTASLAPSAHNVRRSYAIATAAIGNPGEADVSPANSPLQLRVTSDMATAATQLLQRHAVTGEYAVIHPGAGAPVKQWPVHRWRAVARDLANQTRVVVTGSDAERAVCRDIATDIPSVESVAGETPLPTLIGVLGSASIVVGPDCGPLHLAVAAGTRTVHLFGPSDSGRYGPWGPPERHSIVDAGWTCPSCGDLSLTRDEGCGCMLAIAPEAVLSAIHTQLGSHAAV